MAALLAGACAIASSALFVRVSETGPIATAFWRVALALPVLWAWSLARGGHWAAFGGHRAPLVAAGLAFAADLAVWHWSILLTAVATATLLANLAPVFVALAAWALFAQPLSALFLLGLATALAGTAALLGGDLQLGAGRLLGDLLGVLTAVFYATYQLTVTHARARVATAALMAWSGLVTAAALLPLALVSGERILPLGAAGWVKLAALALIAQVAGQSLIAYAMAHLPPTFSSVGLLAQPVAAAWLAWILLEERLGALEIAGGLVVLAGILITHQSEVARARFEPGVLRARK